VHTAWENVMSSRRSHPEMLTTTITIIINYNYKHNAAETDRLLNEKERQLFTRFCHVGIFWIGSGDF